MESYEQKNDMEQLEQKLLCTTLELQKLRAAAIEEMRKSKQYTMQLIDLVKYAIHERDEARSQFEKLLTQTAPLANVASVPVCVTESYSPLYDVVPSPEFSDVNFIQQSNSVAVKIDEESLIIENIASGRVLPEKGKLLKAVLRSGPLLQTLLVAGPLPRWRNPPQCEAFQIPPVTIKGDQSDVFSYAPLSDVGQLSKPYAQMSCGSAQIQTVPMLTFANSGLGNYMSNASGYGLKRQRFC